MSKATLSVTELKKLREHLRNFEFAAVMNDLGWNNASGKQTLTVADETFTLTPIARLGGVQVIEVASPQHPDTLPLEQVRRKLSDEVTKTAREHVLIFVDAARSQSHWYWVKRELGEGNKRKAQPRTHTYIKGQPDDLFIGKLSGLFVDIGELNTEGELPVLEAARRLSTALDSEGVVKKFYNDFKGIREDFASQIGGISDDRDRAWYASVILNRLMFVYFLQGKGFLGRPDARSDGDRLYLQTHIAESRTRGPDRYYSEFLHHLFFDAFAQPEDRRSKETTDMVGQIPYLNGGLFLQHGIELKYPDITIPDHAFDLILKLFGAYTWNLSDQDKHAGGLDPDVLGHIFEKYINQKGFGAYYTRPEITEYLCEQTVRKLVLDKIRERRPDTGKQNENLNDALANADANLVRSLLIAPDGLAQISLLDPACGSGAFLVAALKTVLDIYTALMGRIDAFNDPTLNDWRSTLRGRHESANYNLKKKIITDNLYGVDLMEEATEIAKLRLFLSLVSSANTLDDLEPLPNIDFNILAGNSLIGLLEVDESDYQAQRAAALAADSIKAAAQTLGVVNRPTAKITGQPSMFEEAQKTYRQIVEEYQRDVRSYRASAGVGIKDLVGLRRTIEERKEQAYEDLNPLLHKQFHDLGIRFEEVTWDAAKGKEGKIRKRNLTLVDIADLKPFHWAFEFAEVMERGGFDAVIANPPWDLFKPDGKEFLQLYSSSISKNKMLIGDFEKEKAKIFVDKDTLKEWLGYLSKFPFQNAFFRRAPQFASQTAIVNGKIAGTDLNLYKLFLEQGYRLLRQGGECGIVIPSGVYTDLGAKGLRELLFNKTEVTGLFCFENGSSKGVIFENVHRSFKFVVLSFRKGGSTQSFPAAFMRHEVKDLKDFPGGIGMTLTVDNVRRLSPDSLSIMEFKSKLDAHIAEKMLRFPLLGEQIEGVWNLKLSREFHMTDDSGMFRDSPGPGRLPLFEGKMIHQFRSDWGSPKYWLDEKSASKVLRDERVRAVERELKKKDISAEINPADFHLDYKSFRVAFRDVARNTDARTFITTILPPEVFCPHTMSLESVYSDEIGSGALSLNVSSMTDQSRLFVASIFNSFAVDYLIRQRVTAHVSFFFVYGLPIPRLTSSDPAFLPIVTAAAKLICTTPAFDDLARAAGLRDHTDGVTDFEGRAALRAELDARVAHLYGLSESEFTHILGTFPLVEQGVKDAALEQFKRLAPPEGDPALVRLVQGGEGQHCEFKETFAWDTRQQKAGDHLKAEVFKTVAAFANASGGTLLVGVNDGGRGVGLKPDMQLRPRTDRNPDKFEMYLRQQLRASLSPDVGTWVDISFPILDGDMVCRVEVKPASDDIFTQDHTLYVRRGNESRALKGPELAAHIRRRTTS